MAQGAGVGEQDLRDGGAALVGVDELLEFRDDHRQVSGFERRPGLGQHPGKPDGGVQAEVHRGHSHGFSQGGRVLGKNQIGASREDDFRGGQAFEPVLLVDDGRNVGRVPGIVPSGRQQGNPATEPEARTVNAAHFARNKRIR